MPAAAIPIIGAIAGAGGSAASAAGGKKAQNKGNQLAQQQLKLQQDQFGIAKQQQGLGNAALSPAATYFQNLLQGGQAARMAVSPMTQLIGQTGQGAQRAIQASTPRGGEQNLAVAQNRIGTAGQIANLYTGVQPAAAAGLAGIGGEYLGSGASFNPGANIGAAQGQYGQSQQMAGEAGGGFGSLLYNSLKKLQGNKVDLSGIPSGGAISGLGGYNPYTGATG